MPEPLQHELRSLPRETEDEQPGSLEQALEGQVMAETRSADAGNSGTADVEGSRSAAGGRDALTLSDYERIGERISTMLHRAEEAAEAIVHNAVEVAERTIAEAHERASAELDTARREVESAHHAAVVEEAVVEEVLHVHELAARDMRQIADEIAGRRQEVERASRLLEQRLSRLAAELEPGERISPPPHVTALSSGSASASAREPAVERTVELVIAMVLAITSVAAIVVLLVVLA